MQILLSYPFVGDDVIDESDDQDDDVSSGDENKEEEPQKVKALSFLHRDTRFT